MGTVVDGCDSSLMLQTMDAYLETPQLRCASIPGAKTKLGIAFRGPGKIGRKARHKQH
jgi:hypothetical protein